MAMYIKFVVNTRKYRGSRMLILNTPRAEQITF